MAFQAKATDSQIAASYRKTRSIYKTGAEFGMRPSSAHERLKKLGIALVGNGRPWTSEEDSRIQSEYAAARESGTVRVLSKKLGRAYTALAMRAHQLGVSKASYQKTYSRKIKNESDARKLFDEFKSTGELLWQFCKRKNISDDTIAKHISSRWPDEWEAVIESKAVCQSKYRIGREFEYRVRDIFKKAGYFVLRSPGSKSPTDLVCIKTGAVVFVQCKRSGVIVSQEWNKLFELSTSVGAVPVLAEMPGMRGTILWEMTGAKDGIKRAQPRKVFTP
jgi:Holliday junction resolvase